jgi:uncharacterized protein YjbI with pentapeptide repeats
MENSESYRISAKHSEKKPLGQILIEAGLISISQIELALREQQHNNLRIGEILVAHGWILAKTVDFFCDRWLEVIQEQPKKSLAYYFQEAGLLSLSQCEAIIRLQKLKHQKIRFHRLAVEQGYLKQVTVDFFLAYLFKIYDPNAISIGKPYELLKNYSQGKTDFQTIDLAKATLMSVSLKKINLNGSNLRKADLSRANLSDSSLIQVNLNLANLSNAVLTKVNFTRALLTKANLQQAHLEQANFHSAILQEVNFESAYLARANFSGADLTKAQLPLSYPYEVYYDQKTIFDHDFNPKTLGWKKIKN